MKISLLLGTVVAAAYCATPLTAQQQSVRIAPPLRNGVAPETATASKPHSPASLPPPPAPLNLRSGAKPTGLNGFYDYQSNGMLRGRLKAVLSGTTVNLYTAWMLATDGTDETTASDSRHVGFAASTDGGITWKANKNIADVRTGFPYVDVGADGTPYVACHGVPSSGSGIGTLIYVSSPTDPTTFSIANEFPVETPSGRAGDDGAGVIWPAFVVSPKDGSKGVVAATLSPLTKPTAENDAPLYVSHFEIGGKPAWAELADSSVSAASGGRNPMVVSAGGKIGLAYRHLGGHDETGIYFSESIDGGATWSAPIKVMGEDYSDKTFTAEDTLSVGTNLDIYYNGETPVIVCDGSYGQISSGAPFTHEGIYYWSPSTGAMRITGADSTRGIGVVTAPAVKTQPNMGYVSYPTLSVGNDGQHIVVLFQAAAQFNQTDGAVMSEDGFHYFRVWGVGSPDAGKTWGDPFIVQDFGGDGDSASIEYPSAEKGAFIGGKYIFPTVYQARRSPGMYAFIVADVDGATDGAQPADRGPFSECFQYYQQVTVDADQFKAVGASVDDHASESATMKITRSYPNPASSSVSVDYKLPTIGSVTLKVYNSLGADVLTPVNGESGYAGVHSRNIDISMLPAGAYRLVLTQNGRNTSIPLNIVR
ncbi:MAG: hypothetical protein JWQ98_2141 [Chlorobi bacterium]|nr:hypothetical protein [Chlorobiota bacterium]